MERSKPDTESLYERPVSAESAEPQLTLLDLLAEQYQTFIPVLLLVMGIGAVKLFPTKPTRLFFSSPAERVSIEMRHGTQFSNEWVYVLSSSSCSECTELLSQLREYNVPHQVLDVTTSPLAQDMLEVAERAWGDNDLPKVIIGAHTINPTLETIYHHYLESREDSARSTSSAPYVPKTSEFESLAFEQGVDTGSWMRP